MIWKYQIIIRQITKETWNAVQAQKKPVPGMGKQVIPITQEGKGNPSLLSGFLFVFIVVRLLFIITGIKIILALLCVWEEGQAEDNWENVNQGVWVLKKRSRAILDTVLNRVLTPAYFEELLAELQTQFEDTKAIDQEIIEKQAELTGN